MKAIVILMDSLNRRFLSCYEPDTWVQTPNIDRLAQRCTVFDRHFVGSAPCMPARHDILTGRLDFLEHNWCGVQPYDRPMTSELREQCGVYSHMVTDHYHYFCIGGENYPTVFDSWEFLRGQEHDACVPAVRKPEPVDCYGHFDPQYALNRQSFASEADYPSPRTLSRAADFVDAHHADDHWLLCVDSFDPHEPFDVPDERRGDYGDDYDDKLFYWPDYAPCGDLPEEALAHIRRQYAKTLTMSDRWLGRLLDRMDEHRLWDDTLVILTTDHGFMLGEHTLMGKNYMPAYNEVYNIPLLMHLPGQTTATHVGTLTQNVDLFPTLLSFFGGSAERCPDKLHGRSLLDVPAHPDVPLRESAIYGMFGKQVNITDGRYTYFRSAVRADNSPCNLYTAMPTTIHHYWDRAHIRDVSRIDAGRFLSWTDYPVFRIAGDNTNLSDASHRFDVRYEIQAENMLFDLDGDPAQTRNICGGAEEARMIALLKKALVAHDSPPEQFERLGLD